MLAPESKQSRRPKRSGGRTLLLVAVATLLLGFAGSATAAVLVTGKQIKNNTITTKDLKDGSLKGVDFQDEPLVPEERSVSEALRRCASVNPTASGNSGHPSGIGEPIRSQNWSRSPSSAFSNGTVAGTRRTCG